MARNALVLLAHPYPGRSRAGKALRRAAAALEGVTLHDLYECYPNFVINVGREQQLLMSHDVIVMQHPVYWYSTPALLKEWTDQVLTYGWAYGERGLALRGKQVLPVLTCGGTKEAYSAAGSNHFTIRQLFAPLEATANLCGMRLLEPFVVYGAPSLDDSELAAAGRDYQRQLLQILAKPNATAEVLGVAP